MKVWAGLSVQMEASFVAIMASLDLSSANKDLKGKVRAFETRFYSSNALSRCKESCLY